MRTDNMKIARRRAIRVFGALAVSAFLPYTFLKTEKLPKPLHVVGIGLGGSHVLKHFHAKGLDARFTSISRFRLPELSPEINFIEFVSPGKSTFNKAGKEIYREVDMTKRLVVPNEIAELFKDNHHFVLLAGLGGYTGTYMIQELAPWLHWQNKDFMSICCLPFHFEGEGRKAYAENARKMLKSIPGFTCFSLSEIAEKYGNMSVKRAFEKADEEFLLKYTKIKTSLRQLE